MEYTDVILDGSFLKLKTKFDTYDLLDRVDFSHTRTYLNSNNDYIISIHLRKNQCDGIYIVGLDKDINKVKTIIDTLTKSK